MERIGRYQLVRRLAVGGMAEVFLARAEGPLGFEKQVVIKRVLPHLVDNPRFVELFLTEARVTAGLEHPNIAQVFDLGETDGVPYLAMEYVDGPSLRGLLQQAVPTGRPLPTMVCARLIAQACDALAWAHEYCDPDSGEWLGLIHRDISPENILVSLGGAVKVVDFGIAKAAGLDPSKSASLRGKYAYMAPEQLRVRDRLDKRVDVFALGVVLYELLTGHKPFEAKGELEMMRAIVFSDPVPLRTRRPELPEAMEALLSRALLKDRDRRFESCAELGAALNEVIRASGEDVSAYRVARLVTSLNAIPRTPTGSPFPRATPDLEHTRSSPTRLAIEAGMISASSVAAPVESTPGVSGIERDPLQTRPLHPQGHLPTPETRLIPELPSREISATRLLPLPRPQGAPVLVGMTLLTAGAALMAAQFAAPLWQRLITGGASPAANRVASSAEPGPEARVRVRTVPVAEIWVDGQRIGPSPVELRRPAGEVKLSVKDPGGAFSKDVSWALLPGDHGERELRVERLPVTFHLPGNTRVWVDGLEVGLTPLPPVHLYEGAHTIRLANDALGRDLTTTFEVSAQRANVLSHPLAPPGSEVTP